jgi:transposase
MDTKQGWLSQHKILIEDLLNKDLRAIDISNYILKNYQISISYRTVLRFLSKNGIKCSKTRRYESIKNLPFSKEWLQEQVNYHGDKPRGL